MATAINEQPGGILLTKSCAEELGDNPRQERRYRGQDHCSIASIADMIPDTPPEIAHCPIRTRSTLWADLQLKHSQPLESRVHHPTLWF
jgi:hypothetical protein